MTAGGEYARIGDVELPIVRDARIAPGTLFVAPVGTLPDDPGWRPVGSIEHGEFSIGVDPSRDGDDVMVTAIRVDETITMVLPRPNPRALRILCGWSGPICRFGPRPLGIDGHEYQRRRKARARRGRRG